MDVFFGNGICCGAICVGGLLVCGAYGFTLYNGLVELRNNTERSWANIDVVLKQRSDLIPNLVEAVKGYMKHERGTLEEITMHRGAMLGTQTLGQKAKSSDAITAGLKSIFAVSENYPQLQASENFLKLQEQLAAMENQIADRREFYNNSVVLYNTRISSLPEKLIAGPLGFGEKEYFKATEEEKEAVSVRMDEKPQENAGGKPPAKPKAGEKSVAKTDEKQATKSKTDEKSAVKAKKEK